MKKGKVKQFVGMLVLMLVAGTLLSACSSGKEQEVVSQGETVVAETPNEEVAKSTPEPTAEPTPTPYPLPVVDERYEYRLYSDESKITDKPLIGINLPEGWSRGGTTGSTKQGGGEVCFQMDFVEDNPPYAMVMVNCSEWNYETHFGDVEFNAGYGVLLNKNKEATVETPFGDAEIYYFKAAYPGSDDDSYYRNISDDKILDVDGSRYVIGEQEIAVFTIGGKHATIMYPYYSEEGLIDQYEGYLEGILPQLLEAK